MASTWALRPSPYRIYADTSCASVTPKKLRRATFIPVFFSVRSERRLMEQVRNLLGHWFIGPIVDDEAWDRSSLSKSRDRLLEHAVVETSSLRSGPWPVRADRILTHPADPILTQGGLLNLESATVDKCSQ